MAKNPPQYFRAYLEFITKRTDAEESYGTGSDIIFESPSPEHAKIDVVRWWNNRHKALPDHFHQLFAFKVFGFMPQQLDSNGYLPQNTGSFGFEWKCDHGYPPPAQIDDDNRRSYGWDPLPVREAIQMLQD